MLDEVSHTVVQMLINTAAGVEVPLEQAVKCTSYEARELRRPFARMRWNDFAAAIDGLVDKVGYECVEAVASDVRVLAPLEGKLVQGLVSPRFVFRFMLGSRAPAAYPMIEMTFEELPDGRVRHVGKLRDGFRPSRFFFRLSGSASSSIGHFIGAPRAVVQGVFTDRMSDATFTLPPDRTVLRAAKLALGIEQALTTIEDDNARLTELSRTQWAERAEGQQRRLQSARDRWMLSEREVEVLGGLSRGLSNKELAHELGCTPKTIETHITRLLAQSQSPSRLALVVRFWRDL